MNAPAGDHVLDKAEMARLCNGHDASLSELMSRHGPKLYNYLVRILENEEDAADIAQETFVRVYQHRSRFDPRQKFSTWIYTIATNLVKDRYRYRTRHPQVSIDADHPVSGGSLSDTLEATGPSPYEHAHSTERARVVQRAVSDLPEELRTPLILFQYEGLSHAEIAAILECSAKAVETRIHRAREKLRISLCDLISGR